MVPAIYLFDRFDGPLGILPAVASLTHTEELGGEDTIEFDCAAAPEKGSRLLWRDPEDGAWREHVVARTDEPLAGPARVYAESSISELLGDFIEEERLSAKTAAEALAAVLAHTRWTAGDVGAGDARHGCLLYHVNALAALRRVEEVWGGELECSIAVEGGRVAGRTVSLPARRGGWRGARLTRGKGLMACTRTVLEDEVFTALYGFGRGLPVLDESGEHTGGYTRRLTFGAVNNGVNWVGSDEARLAWGRPDGAGGRAHRFGCVVFAECEDASELKALTEAELARAEPSPRGLRGRGGSRSAAAASWGWETTSRCATTRGCRRGGSRRDAYGAYGSSARAGSCAGLRWGPWSARRGRRPPTWRRAWPRSRRRLPPPARPQPPPRGRSPPWRI